MTLVTAICFFTTPLPNTIFLVLAVAWVTFGQIPLLWGDALPSDYFADSLVYFVIVLATFVLVCLASTRHALTKTQMLSQEQDDFNLLNNMQEGIFVIDKKLKNVRFGSATALRIMNYK